MVSRYRPDIDGLRAIAVLSVVAYHAHLPGVPGGFVGVDVFFVISGYLITQLLFLEKQASGRISITNFYVRRARRILPALLVVILATLVLAAMFLLPVDGGQQGVAKAAIAAIVLSANQYFYLTIGYFNDAADRMPLLHLWSLSVEEQFYLIWPLLFLSIRKTKLLVGVLLCIWGSSFAASAWAVTWDRNAAFFLMPTRAWELATGSLLAVAPCPTFKSIPLRRLGFAGACVGLALIVGAVACFDRSIPFPGVFALVPVLGSALLIWGNGIHNRSLLTRAMSWRPLVAVGLISYSLYLWHWPLLAITSAATLGEMSPLRSVGLVALAFVLASLTYRFVEIPCRRSAWVLDLGRWRTLGVAALSCAVTVTASVGLVLSANSRVRSGEFGWVSQMVGAWPTYAEGCHTSADRFANRKRSSDIAVDHCVENRTPGTAGALILWGDSHAWQYMPLAREYVKQHNWMLTPYTFNACPPAIGYHYRGQEGKQRETCEQFDDEAIHAIEMLTTRYPALGVLLGGRWVEYMGEKPLAISDRNGFDAMNDSQRQDRSRAFKESFERAVARLYLTGIPAVVFLPVPETRFNVSDCLLRGLEDYCAVPRTDFLRYRASAVEFLEGMQRRYPNLTLIDPLSFFCGEEKCPILREGKTVFIDDNHLSVSASQAFGRSIQSQLEQAFDRESRADLTPGRRAVDSARTLGSSPGGVSLN